MAHRSTRPGRLRRAKQRRRTDRGEKYPAPPIERDDVASRYTGSAPRRRRNRRAPRGEAHELLMRR